MSDESTGRLFENTIQPDGSGMLDDTATEVGKAAHDLLDGGDGGEGKHVWDEDPNAIPGLTDPGYLPRTLDPETAARQNAEQAEGRQKAIDEGVDPQTAQLMYPDIDPNDPDRIN